jgi:hypothetical protein
MIGTLLKNELERMWTKVTVTQFEVIPQNLPEGTEEAGRQAEV